MPQNLEIKARIPSNVHPEAVIAAIRAEFVGGMLQSDTYFRAENGRLKLREIDGTSFELIGYHRGESSSRRLSDFRICPMLHPEPLKSVLASSLGLRGVIRKRRMLYRYKSTRIHLDDVDELGSFIEFEAAVGDDIGIARSELDFLISKFHIHENDFLRMSYIDMLEEAKRIGVRSPKNE